MESNEKLVKDKKTKSVSLSISFDDLKTLGYNLETATTRDVLSDLRRKLNIPIRERVGRRMSEFTILKDKLGLPKGASDRDLLKHLRDKGMFK